MRAWHKFIPERTNKKNAPLYCLLVFFPSNCTDNPVNLDSIISILIHSPGVVHFQVCLKYPFFLNGFIFVSRIGKMEKLEVYIEKSVWNDA